MKSANSINTFEKGMITEEATGRYDLEIYKDSVLEATNCIPMTYGGMTKRPGTFFINDSLAYDSVTYDAIRFIPFKTDAFYNYILVFTHGKMQVMINGAMVESAPGVPYELDTGIHGAIVEWMQVSQVNDNLYIVNAWMAPKRLTRIDHDNWKIADVNFVGGPFQDENTYDTLTMQASAVTGNITITANFDAFSSLDVGTKFKFRNPSNVSELLKLLHIESGIEDDTMENYSYANKGEVTQISISGEWDGFVRIQKTIAGEWVDIQIVDYNLAYPETATEDNTAYRCIFEFENNITEDYSTEEKLDEAQRIGVVVVNLTNLDTYGIAKVTSYVSPTVVNATVERRIPTTDALYSWSKGSWGLYNLLTGEGSGYPMTCAFNNQRLILAGSNLQPQTYWGSKVDDYTNFTEGVNADDAFEFTINSTELNNISWLYSGTVLFCGTSKGEYQLSHPSIPLSPTTPYTISHTNVGSTWWTQVLDLGGSILFCQYGPPSIHLLNYDYKVEKFVAVNISEQLKELFQEGVRIKYICQQKKPHNIIYILTDTGFIIAMKYNKNNGTFAYTKLTTDGDYKAIDVVPGTSGDMVYVSVDRGGTYFTLEYFNTFLWEDHTDDSMFMDSALQYVGSAKTNFSNLDHIEGKEVYATVNGVFAGTYTVSGGEVNLDSGKEGTGVVVVNIGLPYQARIKTQRLIPATNYGASFGERVSVNDIKLNIYKTIGLNVGCSDGNIVPVKIDEYPLGGVHEPYTGIVSVNPDSGFDKEQYIIIEHNKPYPMSVLSMMFNSTANSL